MTRAPLASVAIIGLGVIGGSIARDLVARGISVMAYDSDPDTLARARDENALTRPLDEPLTGVESADLVVVAVSAGRAGDILRHLARVEANFTITDVGSTKADVLEEARVLELGRRFVGSHPLAGDHRTGFAHSRTGMFAGATAFLCPAPDAEPLAVRRVENLWAALNARAITIDAHAHDHLLAYASHLPHMAAFAMAVALAREGIAVSDLGPGGRDATRIAGASPEMWTAIALANAAELVPALEALQFQFQRLTGSIRAGDERMVRALLAEASAWRLADPTMATERSG